MGDAMKSIKARTDQFQEDLWKLMTPKYTKRVLVVSTAHISADVNTKLLNPVSDVCNTLVVDPVNGGYLIYTPNPPSESGSFLATRLREIGEHDLASLMHLAVANGFDMIQIDTDGPELPLSLGLPLFDW